MSSSEQTTPATIGEPPVNGNIPTTEPEATPTLSKSAQKRLAKAERFAQLKLERRAREKEQKVAKRKEREERIAAGEDPGPSDAKKRRVSREGEGPVRPFNARIVIDLGFDEKMTEKEVGSLCSQLAYTYAAHRRTRTPFGSLLFTGLNGRSRKQLDNTNDASYRRWKYTEWWEEDIDGLWNPPTILPKEPPETEESVETSGEPTKTPIKLEPTAAPELTPAAGSEPATTNPEAVSPSTPSAGLKQRRAPKLDPTPQVRSACPRESVIYLSADAEDEILELKEGETYVIGGIVDRNRYKNLCANKARDLNIRSARLPIGRYLADMPTRKVLTVNQVFDILVHWVTTHNWEEAMQKVMPKRKFNANGKKGKRSQAQVDEEDGEDVGDEDERPAQPGEKEPARMDDEGSNAPDKEGEED
ncbi:tRNA (guanine(9)-N1)-methyltransferase [Rhizoctonia solani]|uniref:tRNA (guanine(9)-N1)-methyltransferase n=1 Tax=Rhizoctonia solani TaxID=456999 RepID=A0A0K6FVT2_9AGAM|nr:tRNA (guanine(9)-N1)-methyltransferase [Rhizoctonia solani]